MSGGGGKGGQNCGISMKWASGGEVVLRIYGACWEIDVRWRLILVVLGEISLGDEGTFFETRNLMILVGHR